MIHNLVEKRSKIIMKYVAVVFGLIAGLAQAQDQTVEGAQQFIAGIAEEGGMTLTLFYNLVKMPIRIDDDGNIHTFSKTFSPDKVSSTRAVTPCSTKFAVDLNSPIVSSIDYTYRSQGFYTDYNGYMRPKITPEKKTEAIYHPQSKNGTRSSYELSVDWAKVPAVENHGTSVSFLEANGDKVEIFVKTKNYATRLHYAMEFLRIKCDKKSATGF